MKAALVSMVLSLMSLGATVLVFGAEGVFAGIYVFLCFNVTYTIMKDNQDGRRQAE